MNNNLGAFYQLFDKINAADFVLTNFKRFAGGPITIVSDGGKDSINPQFTEVNRNPDWNNKRYSIVHNYKELYK